MTFASVQELQAYWALHLERFAQLRARYLFYAGLKEHHEGLATRANDQAGPALLQAEQDLIADVSHVEVEKDAYYKQMVASLKSEIEAEQDRGGEVRKLVQDALLETIALERTSGIPAGSGEIPPHYEFAELESRFHELEAQLNEYADASTRIARLAETSRTLARTRQEVRRQTLETNKALEESSDLLATLQSSSNESDTSQELAQLTNLMKFLI